MLLLKTHLNDENNLNIYVLIIYIFNYLKKLGNNFLCPLIELMYEKNTKGVFLRFTSFCQVIVEVFLLQIEFLFLLKFI